MFYERFKKLCEEKNTTQTDVLRKLKLSTSSGGAWRRGAMPNGDAVIKLSKYFNVTTDYLLLGEKNAVYESKYDKLTTKQKANINFTMEQYVQFNKLKPSDLDDETL